MKNKIHNVQHTTSSYSKRYESEKIGVKSKSRNMKM